MDGFSETMLRWDDGGAKSLDSATSFGLKASSTSFSSHPIQLPVGGQVGSKSIGYHSEEWQQPRSQQMLHRILIFVRAEAH
jgi:hypothetical protein